MIYIPPEFDPSSLLQYDQMPPAVQVLLEKARICRLNGEWEKARVCVLGAQSFCSAGEPVELALTKLNLVDIYRETGSLQKAVTQCEEAYRTLQRQPSRAQRYNEAIAAYALGLLHQLVGNDMQALALYEEASQQLELAQEYWATINRADFFSRCKLLRRWIKNLGRCTISLRYYTDGGGSTNLRSCYIIGGDVFGPGREEMGTELQEEHLISAIAQVKNYEGDKPLRVNTECVLVAGVQDLVSELFSPESSLLPTDSAAMRFEVAVSAEDMVVEPDWMQPIEFCQGEVRNQVEFRLIPRRAGADKQIRIEYYYQRHWIAQIRFRVEVDDASVSSQPDFRGGSSGESVSS